MATVNIQKIIQNIAGRLKEFQLTGEDTSAGAGDAGKIVLLNSSGKVDATMLPIDITAESISLVVGENVSANDLVYVKAADSKIYKADAGATNKQVAIGYVRSAVTANGSNEATIYFDGAVTSSGFTIGAPVYLSVTAGASTATAPSTTGQLVQPIGVAFSTTQYMFHPQESIELV